MRKTATITITAEGRDKGRVYFLTEMSSHNTEDWALRVFLALGKAGITLPAGIDWEEVKNEPSAFMALIASTGFNIFGGISPYDVAPILAEMMQCVQIIPDPSRPQVVRSLVDDDIDEVATRIQLRKEVVALHTDFFSGESVSRLLSTIREFVASITQTSLAPSALSSPPSSPAS